jgi:hypothetical protein
VVARQPEDVAAVEEYHSWDCRFEERAASSNFRQQVADDYEMAAFWDRMRGQRCRGIFTSNTMEHTSRTCEDGQEHGIEHALRPMTCSGVWSTEGRLHCATQPDRIRISGSVTGIIETGELMTIRTRARKAYMGYAMTCIWRGVRRFPGWDTIRRSRKVVKHDDESWEGDTVARGRTPARAWF